MSALASMATAIAAGVVDEKGEEIFADKVGVMLAREMSRKHPGSEFVVDVKSKACCHRPPVLRQNGVQSLTTGKPAIPT